MRIELGWGKHVVELDVPDQRLVGSRRQEIRAPVADVSEAVRQALEQPFHFPALRRALTPDDHVAIVVDEQLSQPARFLIPILEHVQQAGISCQAITLVCQPPSTGQPWLEDLPDEFQDVHLEVHDPNDRRGLSYLATTRQGRRIYINRTAVDADQLVLLTRRGYDCRLGYSGGEAALFPALSDEATRLEAASKFSFAAPGENPWPIQQEATEVAWLLGAPFLVQAIEGPDGDVANVVVGPIDSSTEGQRLLDARWHVEVDERASMSSWPASAATRPGTPSPTWPGPLPVPGASSNRWDESSCCPMPCRSWAASAELMRLTEDPYKTLTILAKEKPADHEAGFLWCRAAQSAKLYLLSKLPTESAEELFVTPLENAMQAQRVLGGDAS